VKFKIAVLVYKALNDLAPRYLSDDFQLIAAASHCQLQSSVNFKCVIINISVSSHPGSRAFAAAGPRLRNGLPTHVRQLDLTLDSFYRKLKTYFFIQGSSA